MAINYEYYKVFHYVAKYKKISLAAEKLYVSQPAVTQTIQKLEKQLGGNLLVRTKSGIELTEIGKRLYNITCQSIETLDNVEYKFNKYESLEEGIIKIKTGSSLANMLLYKALAKFCKDYPNIKLEISTGAPSKSIEKLHTGETDMVLVYLPFEIEYSNMQVTECAKKEFVFAMSKKYATENKVKVSKIEDLNKYSLIVPIQESAVGKMFNKKFKNKIDNFNYVVAQEAMKKEFIVKNLGIGFVLKDEIKKELKTGEIIEINIPNSKIETSIGVVTLNDKYSNYATKKLLEYLK